MRPSSQDPALIGSRRPFEAGLLPAVFPSGAFRLRTGEPVTETRRERLTRDHRLTTSIHYGAVKSAGTSFRGSHCVIVVLARAGEATRFGFVASKRSVGDAVERNRARRRLREIVRRRWPRLPATGYWIVVIALRSAPTAPHQELATDLEHLLAAAGALAPIERSDP